MTRCPPTGKPGMIWAMILRRLAVPLGVALWLCLVLAVPASSSPIATAAISCRIPDNGEHLGPTYLTSLNVSDTTCSTGLAVVRAYHACQVKDGGVKSECRSTVDGFRCSEKRGPSIPTEFFSSVSCTDRSERVSYKYSQFT